MSRNLILAAGAALAVCIGGSALTLAQNAGQAQPGGASLRPASSFASIANQRDRSVALFTSTITSPSRATALPSEPEPKMPSVEPARSAIGWSKKQN